MKIINKQFILRLSFAKLILSFIVLSVITISVGTVALAQAGTYSFDIGKDTANSSAIKNSILIPASAKSDNFSFYMPVPAVKRDSDKDLFYPDKVIVRSDDVNNLKTTASASMSAIKTSMCPVNTCNVFLNMTTSYLLGQNLSANNNQSYIETVKSNNADVYKFKNIPAAANNASQYVTVELCYSQGRNILGNATLGDVGIYPTDISKGLLYKCTNGKGGQALNNLTSDLTGQFTTSESANSLDCDLKSNALGTIGQTDIFGQPVKGVKTALGCLPGDFSGLFSVVLRIAIGISSAVLMILILINSLNLITNGSNPEKVKTSVGNITKAIQGLLLIIFSVAILSIIGLSLIPFGQIGAGGFTRIFGG